MTNTLSYTPEEVAKILKISRFTVYELIKRGELTGYRVGKKLRVEAPDLDHYIQRGKGSLATASAPRHPNLQAEPILSAKDGLIICGQDILLDVLTRHLEKQLPHIMFLRNYVGTMAGLTALYSGTANLVTAHLWDATTDEYNVPYVRYMLPGQRAVIINLAYRMAGFYVQSGNPKSIRDWKDLAKPGIRIVNREKGSGARVLLDQKLTSIGIDQNSISGYKNEEMSHLAVASCVARGEADVGVGIEKAATQVQNIEFIPLQKERYDLVIRKEDLDRPHFKALRSVLSSTEFRNEVAGLGGYDISRLGEVIANT